MKCPGCGAELQFEDPEKPGFIPYEVFEKKLAEGEEILCRRCFRMKHYGIYEPVRLDGDFLKELKNVLGSFDLVVWVVDITDFDGTYTEKISKILGGKRVIYAVTKVDLMPRALSFAEMKSWLKRRIDLKRGDEIVLVSSLKKLGLKSLKRRLLNSKLDKALVIGVTNVGKSSLISELSDSGITTSSFPGTTLGIVRRKVKGARFYLYDTPGIIVGDRALDLLSPECQAEIVGSKRLTRKTFKMGKERTILIGGMARIGVDFEGDLLPIFQVFTYEGVKLHETNFERSEHLLRNRSGDFLVPPCYKGELDGVSWKVEEYELDVERELVLTGLGWINVKRGPVIFKVEVPENLRIVVRERLIRPRR